MPYIKNSRVRALPIQFSMLYNPRMNITLSKISGSFLGKEDRQQPDRFIESKDALRSLFEEKK